VLASVLLVVAVGLIAVGLRGHQVSLALPHRPEHPASTTSTTTGPAPLRVVARSTPVTLSIPAIGVAVAVSELGLNPDGTVQVPTDFQEPGWYRLGPTPGQVGSAVILGHVDSYRGVAVFFNLRSLTAGDPVDVTLADGVVAHFVVTSVAMYPKDQFPAQQVYGSHGYSQLQLVTCGGTFDSQTGHYLSNIVVYSSLVL
jgi:Sortase domain